MKIIIEYESSWRNSFLNGSNNEALPKKGREFIGSMTNLGKEGNFIKREVTLDTVMGILNRLIGDQRKLYQSRSQPKYYFKDIEPLVDFTDHPIKTSEMTYIRNMKGSTDQNSFTGMIKSRDPMFDSDYSKQLWGVLALNFDELCHFINDDTQVDASIEMDPLSICTQFELLGKVKPVENTGLANQAFLTLIRYFPETDYLTKKGEVNPSYFYCSALYMQLDRMAKKGVDIGSAKTKSGTISGISKRIFTPKDFMNRFTTGEKKKIWGNPYIRKERIKGKGEVVSLLEKASGRLEVDIDIDQVTSNDLKEKIDCAGVSSFYLGKKGLAYVSKIRV